MFGTDRNQLRKMYLDAWRNREQKPQDALQAQICAVIADHPEYHKWLDGDEEKVISQDYHVEQGLTNPFLHMGMHLAVREQIATQRPTGITELYNRAQLAGLSSHTLEHEIMESLGHALWQAQRDNTWPDEAAYLLDIQKRLQPWLKR